MKRVRWSAHAVQNIVDREVERGEVDRTLATPDRIRSGQSDRKSGQSDRKIYMRRYFDAVLQQPMLLRVVVDENLDEIVVVTVYKTSQIDKYMRGPET